MNVILPVRMKIEMRDAGEGNAEFEYTEWPPEGAPGEAVTAAVDVSRLILAKFEKMLGGKCSVTPNEDGSVTMRATCPREKVFDFLAGEFLANSTLGRLTFCDLMSLLAVALAGGPPQPPAEPGGDGHPEP